MKLHAFGNYGSILLLLTALQGFNGFAASSTTWQYESDQIQIRAASAEEPLSPSFSLDRALDYLDHGAIAWSRDRQCVSCHTNGSYLLTRPSLSRIAGPPSEDVREFFVEQLQEFEQQPPSAIRKGIAPTQIAYLAAGLAHWDRDIEQSLSASTSQALNLLLKAQSEDGSFANDDCWPPLESSEYHGATVAALALLAAPNWLESTANPEQQRRVEQLWSYLRSTSPKHDYAHLLLLWVATEKTDLISTSKQQQIIERCLSLQRSDGGWSLRDFAHPEQWGGGNRVERLQNESTEQQTASDGHQTGLTSYVLMKAGVAPDHPQLRQALNWLLTHQRKSGRWWTRSLNTDKYHFITYSGTCYPLMALAEANLLDRN